MLIAFAATAQNRPMKAAEESLVGVWQQVVLDPSSGMVKTYIPYLKIINADGKYIHMRMSAKGPATFNAVGTWKVIAENTYLEYVEPSFDLPKRTEQQTFRIENRTDGVFMFSRFYTLGTDMREVHETWKKCGFAPYAQK